MKSDSDLKKHMVFFYHVPLGLGTVPTFIVELRNHSQRGGKE